MVDNFYNYVANRMRQMGIAKFSMEPVWINETAGASNYLINAQNEYYFLIAEAVHPSLKIFADDNIFDDPGNYGTFNFNYLQEFTGCIEIYQTAATDIQLEFLRVIPED